MKHLKYFAIPAGLLLLFFFIYISYHRYQRNKPVVYIDNFSGSPVELIWNGETFLTIPNNTGEVNSNLGIGKRVIYAKKVGEDVIDTIEMDLQQRGKYVLNLFGAMEYYHGQVAYQKERTRDIRPVAAEQRITRKFFPARADFIFEDPPASIEVYTKKSKYNYNIEAARRYLRRGNPIKVEANQPVMAEENAVLPAASVTEEKNSTSPSSREMTAAPAVTEEETTVKEVLVSMAEGDVKSALTLLAITQPEISTPLQERYEEVQKKRRLGAILMPDYYREVNQISQAILSSLPQQKVPARKVPDSNLQSLINANKLAEAIDLAIAAGQREAVLLQGQLSRLNADKSKGVITEQYFKTEEARIKQGLLYFNENY